jgi:hypothetical protein
MDIASTFLVTLAICGVQILVTVVHPSNGMGQVVTMVMDAYWLLEKTRKTCGVGACLMAIKIQGPQ